MEQVLLICLIILAIVLYFCFGAIIKFVWGWFPTIFGVAIGLLMGIFGGWGPAAFGLLFVFVSVALTDSWQGSTLYLTFDEKIDKIFYFKD